ncbi:hypothetical protein C8Q76DRAFT_689207 [Earliella scabrosa]|nr:hypothetical protein C8Q76DRAFT_689207 [Earliella scabrosa]
MTRVRKIPNRKTLTGPAPLESSDLDIMRSVKWGRVLRTFQAALSLTGRGQTRFYGVWNELLDYAFLVSERVNLVFLVWPRTAPIHDLDTWRTDRKIDSSTWEFLVCTPPDLQVVLFVQIHDPYDLDLASARAEADLKVRARCEVHAVQSKLPNLYAISAFGNMVRFYTANKETGVISPPAAPPPLGQVMPADHLEDAWNVDILSPTGLHKMRRIVKDITIAMCKLNLENVATASDEEVLNVGQREGGEDGDKLPRDDDSECEEEKRSKKQKM